MVQQLRRLEYGISGHASRGRRGAFTNEVIKVRQQSKK
jgi:hypothetical protein